MNFSGCGSHQVAWVFAQHFHQVRIQVVLGRFLVAEARIRVVVRNHFVVRILAVRIRSQVVEHIPAADRSHFAAHWVGHNQAVDRSRVSDHSRIQDVERVVDRNQVSVHSRNRDVDPVVDRSQVGKRKEFLRYLVADCIQESRDRMGHLVELVRIHRPEGLARKNHLEVLVVLDRKADLGRIAQPMQMLQGPLIENLVRLVRLLVLRGLFRLLVFRWELIDLVRRFHGHS